MKKKIENEYQIVKAAREASQPKTEQKAEVKTDTAGGSNPAMKAAAKSFGGGSSLADTAASAGMASGNPAVMGAALGLSVLSGISKKKQQEKQAAYENKVTTLNNLSNMARKIRPL